MTIEKREFLVQVSVKRKKTGAIHNLKRYVEAKLDWQGTKGVLAEKDKIISLESKDEVPEEGGFFGYNFKLTNLEVARGFFKDKVVKWKLEPVQDKESTQIAACWGTQVSASQYRASGFLIGTAFLLLVGGILAWVFVKKKQNH